MLMASTETRQRMRVLAIGVTMLFGGWAAWGALSHFFSQRAAAEVSAPRPSSEGVERARLSRALTEALVTLGKRGAWDDVIRLVDTASSKTGDCPPQMRALRAEAHFRQGRVAEGGADYAHLMRSEGPRSLPGLSPGADDRPQLSVPVNKADVLALKGERKEYVALCEEILGRTDPQSADALNANNAAWACALLPDALPRYDKPLALARRAVERAGEDSRATYLNTLGVVQYRAGQYAEAVKTLTAAEAAQVEPFNWPFLALAQRHLGKPDEATRWEKRLDEFLDKSIGQSGNNRHELLLFWNELKQAPRR